MWLAVPALKQHIAGFAHKPKTQDPISEKSGDDWQPAARHTETINQYGRFLQTEATMSPFSTIIVRS
jgi:hypothetical protein